MHMNRLNRGFSLIELMVSMTIGLIVISSATALMVSVMDANGRTIRSTRLTQEIRAVSDIVTRELRRARYNPNAAANFGENGDDDDGDGIISNLDSTFAVNPFETVAVSNTAGTSDGDATTIDGECIQYAYGNAPGGAFRTISRVEINGRGVVRLARANGASPGCGTGVDLTSPQVDVTLLAFNFDNNKSNTDPDYDTIRITLQGRLAADNDTQRRFVETVRLRTPSLPPTPILPPPPPAP